MTHSPYTGPILPCWILELRHERESGALGRFHSRPLTYSHALRLAREYEATGTPAVCRPVERLLEINRALISRRYDYDEAQAMARDEGLL